MWDKTKHWSHSVTLWYTVKREKVNAVTSWKRPVIKYELFGKFMCFDVAVFFIFFIHLL